MPEIKRFSGFKLLMFFQDENPPHVHLKGPDFAAKIRLSNGELIAGDGSSEKPVAGWQRTGPSCCSCGMNSKGERNDQ